VSNSSHHFVTDSRGLRGEIAVFTDDDSVVFGSTPPLCFDWRAAGCAPWRGEYYLMVHLTAEGLYLTNLSAKFLLPPPAIFGVKPTRQFRLRWAWHFDDLPWDYTGTLSLGRDFDPRFWPENDYTERVPFSPEVYRENGEVRLERGIVCRPAVWIRTADKEVRR